MHANSALPNTNLSLLCIKINNPIVNWTATCLWKDVCIATKNTTHITMTIVHNLCIHPIPLMLATALQLIAPILIITVQFPITAPIHQTVLFPITAPLQQTVQFLLSPWMWDAQCATTDFSSKTVPASVEKPVMTDLVSIKLLWNVRNVPPVIANTAHLEHYTQYLMLKCHHITRPIILRCTFPKKSSVRFVKTIFTRSTLTVLTEKTLTHLLKCSNAACSARAVFMIL